MKPGARLFVHREHLHEDGWTYGDWRQYVAFRANGSAVICRLSELPSYLGMLGFGLLLVVAMIVLVPHPEHVRWGRLFVFAFVGFLLLAPGLLNWLSPYRLVVALSAPTWPDANGLHWRRFEHDEDEDKDDDDDRSWWDETGEANFWRRG